MANNDDSGDRTEKPTAKRLKDARKDGNVSKSKELTSTLLVLVWLLLFWLMSGPIARQVVAIFELVFRSVDQPFGSAAAAVGWLSLRVLLGALASLMVITIAVAVLVEFLQAGPVFALKRIKPDLSRMNPAEGLKRMFSMDNLVELLKAVIKTAALGGIGWLVVTATLSQILRLPMADPRAFAATTADLIQRTGLWVVGVFLFVAILDAGYQKYSHIKKLRMSMRDIKREARDDQGDPYVKSRRKQLHQEWANQNMAQAVRGANAVVTNPTHVAVAIRYEPGETVVPVVVAKGEDHVARMIRETAEEAGIPIMQNIPLARALNEKVEIDDYIPVEFFEAVAELLRWARTVAGGPPADEAPPRP